MVARSRGVGVVISGGGAVVMVGTLIVIFKNWASKGSGLAMG